MAAYYNEFDPKAAAWLRELIKRGLIADGIVDERSIIDVEAKDLVGFAQCHFFAGIGGWSHALRLAGIPDDYPIWTGSCPCQPFSVAGANKGKSDERHLWPAFFDLIKQSRPDTVFGEQVEGAVKHGWLDDLQTDLEGEGYAVGAAVLGAHSVGSFHQRQRLYWVADDSRQGHKKQLGIGGISRQENDRKPWEIASRSGRVEHSDSNGCESRGETAEAARHGYPADSAGGNDSILRGPEKSRIKNYWSNPDWIECRDNKLRPIKPGLEPLANGIPARVVRLRGYGNAIVPQVAAEFIGAFFEII